MGKIYFETAPSCMLMPSQLADGVVHRHAEDDGGQDPHGVVGDGGAYQTGRGADCGDGAGDEDGLVSVSGDEAAQLSAPQGCCQQGQGRHKEDHGALDGKAGKPTGAVPAQPRGHKATGERRQELVKQCNKIGERSKVEVRNVRGEVKDKLKKAIKDGLSEDLEKDAEADLQKLHDKYIKKIDDLLEAKQKEIMTV